MHKVILTIQMPRGHKFELEDNQLWYITCDEGVVENGNWSNLIYKLPDRIHRICAQPGIYDEYSTDAYQMSLLGMICLRVSQAFVKVNPTLNERGIQEVEAKLQQIYGTGVSVYGTGVSEAESDFLATWEDYVEAGNALAEEIEHKQANE